MAAKGKVASKALKGIMKPLEKLLKECDDVLAKAAKAGRKGATASTRAARESAAQRAARTAARQRARGMGTPAGSWGDRARALYGDPPSWMTRPHGHHVVFKKGSAATKPYIDQSQAILRHFGIDPVHGPANLIWAPNKAHSVANAREVLSRLTEAARSGGGRQAVEDALARAGREVFDGWP